MKTTQHEIMYQRIREHGEQLKEIFGLSADTDPVKLCKGLRRCESRAHMWAEDVCNGRIDPSIDEVDEQDYKVKVAVAKLLPGGKVPIIYNKDPRGYALKIDAEWMKDHPWVNLHKDWGGYGILAPDFR